MTLTELADRLEELHKADEYPPFAPMLPALIAVVRELEACRAVSECAPHYPTTYGKLVGHYQKCYAATDLALAQLKGPA